VRYLAPNDDTFSNTCQFDAMIARVPMGRWGVADEVAYVASFVLSDKASFVTGASLVIDGGLSVH
jgi:NAD(P)-dependent dehydrogenase (short-subunit alcohol dehydrogenase family)